MEWFKSSEVLPSTPRKAFDFIDCLIIHKKKITLASFCWNTKRNYELNANDWVPVWIIRCNNCYFLCKDIEVIPEYWMPLPELPEPCRYKAKKKKTC